MRPWLALCLTLLALPLRAETITVAAAANLKFALEQIATDFEHSTGHKLRLSFGSSGNFATQLSHGAPFELFLSADEAYVLRLHQQGITDNDGLVYAYGRLALVAAKDSPLLLDANLDGLKQLLSSGQLQRFAIANPELAPYGERARGLLEQKGLWQALQPRLVLGENVSQAAQFALGGSAQGGIVALSLTQAPAFKQRARVLALPLASHKPLAQRMVLLPGAGQGAQAFYTYLQSEPARQVLADFGFALPEQP